VASEQSAAAGRAIREIREGLGLSQTDLADGTGIGQYAISRVETAMQEISLNKLSAIASFLGVGIGTLIEGSLEGSLDLTGLRARFAAASEMVHVKASVVCDRCGVLAAGIGLDDANSARIKHVREHVGDAS
jgi:transcriptional regulator with XRE-family HTH domain